MSEIIGQPEIVRRLTTLVDIARRRGEVFGHTLFVGPDGSGKRTLAHCIAREMEVNLRAADSYSIERPGDLAAMVNDLDKGDVFLLTDIDRLNKSLVLILGPAMTKCELNIIVGKGPGARRMLLMVKPFTLIGTVQKQTDCAAELLRAFDATVQLQRYTPESMLQLTLRMAELAKIEIEADAAVLVANLADGNPGRAESILRKLRLVEKRPISVHDAREMLSVLGYSVPRSESLGHYGHVDLNSLSGIEFERLITAALNRMAFVAEMTRTTGDGGIDIEASLDRPLVGGRYLIQCKRFSPDTLVGSPAVREFYGALIADRRAAKGILITTSGFSAQARDFAANLPIDLIDGEQLAKLLSD
jgi:Holliday junction DNA helicase RuvB P-loop domain/Restriction endonuclease